MRFARHRGVAPAYAALDCVIVIFVLTAILKQPACAGCFGWDGSLQGQNVLHLVPH